MSWLTVSLTIISVQTQSFWGMAEQGITYRAERLELDELPE